MYTSIFVIVASTDSASAIIVIGPIRSVFASLNSSLSLKYILPAIGLEIVTVGGTGCSSTTVIVTVIFAFPAFDVILILQEYSPTCRPVVFAVTVTILCSPSDVPLVSDNSSHEQSFVSS